MHIEGHELLRRPCRSIPSIPHLDLEGLANRNSEAYLSQYQLSEHLGTIFRGTIRYKGFAAAASALQHLGLLSPDALHGPLPTRWSEVLGACLNQQGKTVDLEAAVVQRLESGGFHVRNNLFDLRACVTESSVNAGLT